MPKLDAPPRKAATIKDVARELGVSISAVSYALNGRGTIGEDLRSRVREAADRVGYRPNHLARAVRTGRTMSLGLVVPDLNNPYYPAMAQAVERAAREAGYTIVLDTSGNDDDEDDAVRQFENYVAGAVWCKTTRPDHDAKPFRVPIVVIGSPEPGFDTVTADDTEGGFLAADYLLGLGHRRVGILTGASVPDGLDDRRAAFVGAYAGKGEIVWDVKTPYSIDLDHRLFTLLDRRDVTAIMCGNDQIAIGVLRAARQLKIEVPGELSVIGFDDIPWAAIVTPALTTIHQPVAAMAAAAVALLLDRIEDANRAVQQVKVGVKLVERDSTSTTSVDGG